MEEDIEKCEFCLEQQTKLNEYTQNYSDLFEKYNKLSMAKTEREKKLELAIKDRDASCKEKEMVVLRYANSEKSVLEQKALKEQFEKKYIESIKENDILQHRVSTMVSEKSRICQMLDNKCYELKKSQIELEKVKSDFNLLETKLKWSQNNLKVEKELCKENDAKIEALNSKLQEALHSVETSKKEAQDSIKAFHKSQENRANVLEEQMQEQQAQLILLRHERDDREEQIKTMQLELERIQNKQKETLNENNAVSLKIQHLEKERLENEQKLSELRQCADKQKQDSAEFHAKNALISQLELQLKNEHEQFSACREQMNLLKQRNSELETDIESCRIREAELLLFTQQLTDKNVKLQSEYTSMETKVQQLTCEQNILKRSALEQETKANILSNQLEDLKKKFNEECGKSNRDVTDKKLQCEKLCQEVIEQKGENSIMKRKYDLLTKELNKELHQCKKKLEQYESSNSKSKSSSSSSLTNDEKSTCSSDNDQSKDGAEYNLDKSTLIEHIIKLQRISVRKSEKIDFLEEHVNTLVAELQKKSRLLHSYIIRYQGALPSK